MWSQSKCWNPPALPQRPQPCLRPLPGASVEAIALKLPSPTTRWWLVVRHERKIIPFQSHPSFIVVRSKRALRALCRSVGRLLAGQLRREGG